MNFNEKAGSLHAASIENENFKEISGIDYSEQRVRIAIVHTREDIVLIYSQINSINEQLNEIKENTKVISFYIKIAFYAALVFVIIKIIS
jgi:hypothetical protein